MRSSSVASPLPGESKSHLVPELVLILLVVGIGRFLVAGMGIKVQLGLVCALLVSAAVRARNPINTNKSGAFNYLPALGLLSAVILTYRDGPHLQAAIFFLVFAMFYFLRPVVGSQSAYDSLLAGMVLYLVANIAGWLGGIRSPSASYRLIGFETSSPFFNERIIFPFSQSMNETPYIATALLLAIIAMLKIGRPIHWYHWIGLVAAPFVLLAANNRTTFVIVIVLIAGVLFAPRVTRLTAPYVAGASLLLPLLVGLVRPITDFAAGFLQGSSLLGRGGTVNSIGAFAGRDSIWGGVINFWSDLTSQGFTEIPSIFFGYGFRGHVTSGAYLYIPKIYSEFLRDRTFLHAHNSVLQESLDGGLIGAAIIWSVVVLVVYKFSQGADLLPIAIVSLTVALSGVIESALAPGMNFIVFYILIYLAFFLPGSGGKGAAGTTSDAERAAVFGAGHRRGHASLRQKA